MNINREKLREILTRMGQALKRPTALCLIGSAPGILAGQMDRNTADIDVWRPMSKYTDDDLEAACAEAGLRFDPKGDVDDDDIYIQIVEPGIVALPENFEPYVAATFGNLDIVIPPASAIAASTLVRASPQDVEDIGWWMRHRALTVDEIAAAIRQISVPSDRETAMENLVYVRLLEKRRP